MGVFFDDPDVPGGDGRMYLMRSVENNFAGRSYFSTVETLDGNITVSICRH
jgi:hypothetical protein